MKSLKERLVTQAVVALGLLIATGSATAQNWVNQSNMKVPRVEASTVDYRDDIYVFNGFKHRLQIANSVEKYDAATKQWSIISTTSVDNGSAVTHNGTVRVGTDVWIIGGRIGRHPGVVSNKVWIFNLNTQKWRRGPDLPAPVAGGGAALVNNKIHWIGGLDRNARCDVGTHFVYNLGQPSAGWKNITVKAGMPSPRNHFSTAVVNGVIYAMGGQYGHDACPGKFTQDTTLVHAFNPKNNSWSRKADLPNKNSHAEPGTFVYKGDIYTTGGENAKNKVWKYNPRTNKWSTFRTLAENLVAPVARIVDGHLVVAGGGAPIAQQATNRVRSLKVDNNPPAVKPESTPEPTPEPAPEPPKEPVPGSQKPKGDTLISMEAEYFDVNTNTSTHQWIHTTIGNSSNDDAMTTNPDQGELAGTTENTPMLSYLVYFNHPGKHYLWVRGFGDSNKSGVGNSDSIHIGLNGTVSSSAYRVDQFPSQWTWSRHTPGNPVASLNVVEAGVNIVNIWMREDGLAIDKFVITSNPNFVPTGFGPEVTDGTQAYEPPNNDEVDDANAVSNDDASAVVNEEPMTKVPDPVNTNSSETALLESDSDQSQPNENDQVESATPSNEKPQVIDEQLVDSGLSKREPVQITETSDATSETEKLSSIEVVVNNDAQVSKEPIDIVRSSDGLFGGSASITSLLALLWFGFIRFGPSRPVRAR